MPQRHRASRQTDDRSSYLGAARMDQFTGMLDRKLDEVAGPPSSYFRKNWWSNRIIKAKLQDASRRYPEMRPAGIEAVMDRLRSELEPPAELDRRMDQLDNLGVDIRRQWNDTKDQWADQAVDQWLTYLRDQPVTSAAALPAPRPHPRPGVPALAG